MVPQIVKQFFVAIFGIFCSSPIKIDGSDVAPQVVHHVPIEAENWMSALFSFLFVLIFYNVCNSGCAVCTMVKLRLNALIGIFLLLADEGHTITCVLIFRTLNRKAISKKSENGKG